MKKERWLLIAAAGGGALIWVLISTASGKKEAWDSDLYFSVGMPAVCLLAALLGFLEPKRTAEASAWLFLGWPVARALQ